MSLTYGDSLHGKIHYRDHCDRFHDVAVVDGLLS